MTARPMPTDSNVTISTKKAMDGARSTTAYSSSAQDRGERNPMRGGRAGSCGEAVVVQSNSVVMTVMVRRPGAAGHPPSPPTGVGLDPLPRAAGHGGTRWLPVLDGQHLASGEPVRQQPNCGVAEPGGGAAGLRHLAHQPGLPGQQLGAR